MQSDKAFERLLELHEEREFDEYVAQLPSGPSYAYHDGEALVIDPDCDVSQNSIRFHREFVVRQPRSYRLARAFGRAMNKLFDIQRIGGTNA